MYNDKQVAELLEMDYGIEAPLSDRFVSVEEVLDFINELDVNGLINVDVLHEITGCIKHESEISDLIDYRKEDRDWIGVANLLSGIESMSEDYYYLNGYGNLENLEDGVLKAMVSDLLNNVEL